MKKISFSKNAKLNKVLNAIYVDLLSIHDTEAESVQEIVRYRNSFPKEADYNLYQYGNLLIWDGDIVELYKDYKSLKKASIDKIRDVYKKQVGYIARYILSNN